MAAVKANVNESLFSDEKEILETAMADIVNEHHSGNELLPRYKALVSHYQKLLRITRKSFYISDSQGHVLQRQQNEIQNLLDNANQGFLTFGQDLNVDQKYSAECTRIFGKKIAGVPVTELLAQGDSDFEQQLAATFTHVFSYCDESQQQALALIPAVVKIDNKDIQVECKLLSQLEESGTLVMMILTDITDRIKAEEEIRFLSYHDKLTSVYNRAYVESILSDYEKPEALPLSVIMLDMNGLKLINDVFGHQQGDSLLVAMARVLEQSCKEKGIVARWGGDEFLILMPQTNIKECHEVCGRIYEVCSAVKGHSIPLSAAIGSATKESGIARIAELFNIAENRMYTNKLNRGKEVRKRIIASLEGILYERCFLNNGHSQRVKRLGIGFAQFLGLDINSSEIKPLGKLAKLHDIGKVAIPKDILGKPGPLTLNEWKIVKGHSDIGYRVAQSIGEPALADIILVLRERWDGSGYPYGLKGDQIPLLARIFTLADTYDVITHDRPYKKALDIAAAINELSVGSGSQFDPELTKKFVSYLSIIPRVNKLRSDMIT